MSSKWPTWITYPLFKRPEPADLSDNRWPRQMEEGRIRLTTSRWGRKVPNPMRTAREREEKAAEEATGSLEVESPETDAQANGHRSKSALRGTVTNMSPWESCFPLLANSWGTERCTPID